MREVVSYCSFPRYVRIRIAPGVLGCLGGDAAHIWTTKRRPVPYTGYQILAVVFSQQVSWQRASSKRTSAATAATLFTPFPTPSLLSGSEVHLSSRHTAQRPYTRESESTL